jgi:hypothetical protein
MTVPYIRLDGVRLTPKKRAKEIKEKLLSFGVDINLSRSYEILAALCGYRNWATMSASEPGDEGAFLVGFQEEKYVHSVEWTRIELPHSVAKNHVEIVGEGYLSDNLVSFAKSAMQHKCPVVFISSREGLDKVLEDVASEAGRSGSFVSRKIDSTVSEGDVYDPFQTMSAEEAAEFIDLTVRPYERARWDSSLWIARIVAAARAVAASPHKLRSAGFFLSRLQLHRLIEASVDDAASSDAKLVVKSYLSSLPGFLDQVGERQGQTTVDQHGHVEDKITRALHKLRSHSTSIQGPSHNLSVFDEVVAGGIVHIDHDRDLHGTDIQVNLIADLCARLRLSDRSGLSAPTVLLMDNIADMKAEFLDCMLSKCKEMGVVAVLGSEKRLPLANMKLATTIQVEGSEARFVTPTQNIAGFAPSYLDARPVGNGRDEGSTSGKRYREML